MTLTPAVARQCFSAAGRCGVIALLVACPIGCGGKPSSTAPTTTPPAPAPTLYTVTGIVGSSATGAPIQSATARIVDGPNAGLTAATDASGRYRLNGLTFAAFAISVTAGAFFGQTKPASLTAGTPTATLDFSLTPQDYSGTWNGTTEQDLPISFTVTGTTVNALSVNIRLTLSGTPPGSPPQPAVTCVSTFRAAGPVAFSGDRFEVPVTSISQTSPSGAFYTTTARGTLGTPTSDTSAAGTIASFTVSKISPPGCFSKAVDCSWPGSTCTQGPRNWTATRQ